MRQSPHGRSPRRHTSRSTLHAPGSDRGKRTRDRLHRRYQFCNRALIALPITYLWPRTAPTPRYQIARQQRWTRTRLRPRHRTASRSGLLSLGSAQRPATDSSGVGAQGHGSVQYVRCSVITECEDLDNKEPHSARVSLPRKKRGRAAVAPITRSFASEETPLPALTSGGPQARQTAIFGPSATPLRARLAPPSCYRPLTCLCRMMGKACVSTCDRRCVRASGQRTA